MSETDFCIDGVLNGKTLAKTIRRELKEEVAKLVEKYKTPPKLCTILVGEDPGSQLYVRMKNRSAKRVGILSDPQTRPDDTTQDSLLKLIEKLNNDKSVHGILVQLPLPNHIDEKTVINAIAPEKDVDGFSPSNIHRLFYGEETLSSATPHGIVMMLDAIGMNDLSGKKAVIINRSTIVGKPLIMLLLNRNATVTVCHSRTKDLASITKEADVLVSAIGRRKTEDDPFFITEDMVKHDAVVIDVASPHGDVDFQSVKEKAKCITPVPGGVGPMTIAMLLRNVVDAYKSQMT